MSQENPTERSVSNTLGLACEAAAVVRVTNEDDLQAARDRAGALGVPVLPLGIGSNVVLPPRLNALVVQVVDDSVTVLEDSARSVLLRVGAGKNWHELVEETLAQGWYGLENLALIPGLVGAAPVQNIGAYGRELSDFAVAVHGFDLRSGHTVEMSAKECRFAYRESVFKRRLRDKFVIQAVDLRLWKVPQLQMEYPTLKARLQTGRYERSPQGVYEAVLETRRARLPDPATRPNVGSFFKNPVLSVYAAELLSRRFPDLLSFGATDGFTKLSAAWLIDRAGLGLERRGGAVVSRIHALVIENSGGATQADVLELAKEIQERVEATYGVKLEPEPRIFADGSPASGSLRG